MARPWISARLCFQLSLPSRTLRISLPAAFSQSCSSTSKVLSKLIAFSNSKLHHPVNFSQCQGSGSAFLHCAYLSFFVRCNSEPCINHQFLFCCRVHKQLVAYLNNSHRHWCLDNMQLLVCIIVIIHLLAVVGRKPCNLQCCYGCKRASIKEIAFVI